MKLTVIFSIIVLSSVSLVSSIGAENLDHVKKFKQTKQCPGCDLSGADLSGLNLRQANLQGADLSGASLRGSDLTK
ncbi:MAG: pentapeptide repeat-containing protein, partial [Microcystis panniformis]